MALPTLLITTSLADGAFAQTVAPSPAGRVEGQVKDALDRPLGGVRLRLEAPDGRVVGQATTDANGRYAVTGVAPGLYSLIGERDGFQTGTALVTVEGQSARSDLVLASRSALELSVQAKRLNEQRDAIAPNLGATTHTLDRKALENQAQGDDAPFNQTLLRLPGVAQDSFGQLHVRGDHANLQYRINGVLIPEGITGFGQVFDTRLAERVSLITGALPAQFGYRTAGIIDIQTKSGDFGDSGELGMYGGSYGTLNPSGQAYGSSGPMSWFATGNYLENKIGIESPDGTRNPIHDYSKQGKGFGYFSYLVNPDTRVNLFAGGSVGHFEIPNRRGVPTAFQAFGQSSFDSSALNSTQREINEFAALSYQQSLGDLNYQVSLFTRYSGVQFRPDVLGELLFNGSASRIDRTATTYGLQADGSYKLNDSHTLRHGVFYSGEKATSNTDAQALLVDGTGAQATDPITGNLVDTPTRVLDGNVKWGYLAGIYLQDEWRLTDRLTLNYGARFDYYDAFITDNQISPRLNATYKLTERTTVHAGYARYFTPPPLELIAAPTLNAFSGTALQGQSLTASPVKAQKDNYFDAGITHQVNSNLRLGVDGYYRDIDHLIDEGQFGTALIFTPFNYKKGEIYGVEFTVGYEDGPFSSYANLGYSVAKGRQIESAEFNFGADELAYIATHDVHLDHDQRYTASFGAAYEWAGVRFYGDGLVGSGLRRGFANTQSLPAYFTSNTGASYRFTTSTFGDMTARLDVINLFDEKYQLRDGSGIGVGAPQFGLRRAFFAGVSKRF
ncbi:MAG: TonB-dependent receptor [Alphaproteobacteria bacterium]|nr:TonB-dependent receptor [Alphaproteobacteria bacterium]